MSSSRRVSVRQTQYTVCALPTDHPDYHHFAITVEDRGDGNYAVCRFNECLGADGTWDYEPLPSSRTDEWLASHRFDLNAALDLAVETAPAITVNGHTVDDVL